ncbi:hypothetical protein CE91St51_10950 [[Clostridium] innocuum]|nr:hypothetical protein CE91St51_10950 [[Clostridium] innocuum]
MPGTAGTTRISGSNRTDGFNRGYRGDWTGCRRYRAYWSYRGDRKYRTGRITRKYRTDRKHRSYRKHGSYGHDTCDYRCGNHYRRSGNTGQCH